MNHIKEWVPGMYPIPFFQTWCCECSSVTPSSPDYSCDVIFQPLLNAGLPPKMYECVRENLVLNRVGVDCIHYLFCDSDCRSFIAREYPPDVLMAYDRLIPTAFKADLWRYCVLYKYGGGYLDAKLEWGFRPPTTEGRVGGCGGVTLRAIVDRWLAGGDVGVGVGGDDSLLVLERDGVGLWPTHHFGIHNAFIITKPKNPLFLDCIFNIVSYAKVGGLGHAGTGEIGWMTRPLFVTGPGLLGNVWRKRFIRNYHGDGGGGGDVPDSYASMAPYFRFFFEGDGVIGYFLGDGDRDSDSDSDSEEYIKLFKVYDGYQEEYHHMMRHVNCVPHYTVLWSQGIVWRGGVPPPATVGGSAPSDGSSAR